MSGHKQYIIGRKFYFIIIYKAKNIKFVWVFWILRKTILRFLPLKDTLKYKLNLLNL